MTYIMQKIFFHYRRLCKKSLPSIHTQYFSKCVSAYVELCLFGIVSIRDGVHLGSCQFGIVFIRDRVHSGWCPLGMVSIRAVIRKPSVTLLSLIMVTLKFKCLRYMLPCLIFMSSKREIGYSWLLQLVLIFF